MRLKNNPKAYNAIQNSPLCIQDPAAIKSNWKSSFSIGKPIYIEVGCGKGQFLWDMAHLFPDIFFLGIEMYETVLYSAVKKWGDTVPENIRFICMFADQLENVFSKGEVDRIYLNFSDPWPKARHAKRRLTAPGYLERYKKIIKQDGLLEFKTDNSGLFDYSLEQLTQCSGFSILASTQDLYNDPHLLKGNVPTEYENKFHSQNKPIHKIIAQCL